MTDHLKSKTLAEMGLLFKEMGQPAFRAKQVYTWLHKGVRSYDEMTNLPKNLRDTLSEQYPIQPPHKAAQRRRAEGAAHPAAHLRGNADGVAVVIAHQHRFHAVSVGKLPQILDGAILLGLLLPDDLRG